MTNFSTLFGPKTPSHFLQQLLTRQTNPYDIIRLVSPRYALFGNLYAGNLRKYDLHNH